MAVSWVELVGGGQPLLPSVWSSQIKAIIRTRPPPGDKNAHGSCLTLGSIRTAWLSGNNASWEKAERLKKKILKIQPASSVVDPDAQSF